MNLLDLPQDVLSIVLAHLDPIDYLAFCRTTRGTYDDYRQESAFWRNKTASTFRLPISPLLNADGSRWYWLYKRLKTQTRLFTWGQGLKHNLGPGRAIRHPRLPPRPRMVFQRVASSWPTETHVPDEVGVIADLQCGGWSTTILSSEGKLYTTGSLDSMDGITIGETAEHFTRLDYLTQSTSAIQQFSAGRRHVLGLTDDGEILSWDRVNAKGYKIFSRRARDFGGKATRVAAGWQESSAYIPETGIVYWTPVQNDQPDEMLDGVHVREKIIPGTAHRPDEPDSSAEVVIHVVLAEFIVWITKDSKLFACDLSGGPEDQSELTHAPFEVPGYAAEGRELKDLQGQFQNFGLFTAAGEVLAGNVEYLRRCSEAARNNPSIANLGISEQDGAWSTLTTLLSFKPNHVPALQHTGVIKLAYGDYHYHALHADGSITSYGTDSGSCGQTGLGNPDAWGRLRGLKKLPNLRDAKLLPIAELRGRHVWFEPEKKDWLAWLESEIRNKAAHLDTGLEPWHEDASRQAAMSEWVEQEGRHWHEGPLISSDKSAPGNNTNLPSGDYDRLGAYFAISIAAAGWHSGALVLVDEDEANKTRALWVKHKDEPSKTVPGAFENIEPDEEYVWKIDGCPKVQLPDGYETPGKGEPRSWRDGQPTMEALGLAQTTVTGAQQGRG